MAYNVKARKGESRYTKDSPKYGTDVKKNGNGGGGTPVQYANTYVYQKYVNGRLMDVTRNTTTGRDISMRTSSRQITSRLKPLAEVNAQRLRSGQSTVATKNGQRFRVSRDFRGGINIVRIDTAAQLRRQKAAERLERKKKTGQKITGKDIFQAAGYKKGSPLKLTPKKLGQLRASVGNARVSSVIRSTMSQGGITLPRSIYARINKNGLTQSIIKEIEKSLQVAPSGSRFGGGTYSAANFSTLEKLQNKLDVLEVKLERKIQKGKTKGFTVTGFAGAAAGSFALGVAQGFSDTVGILARPKTTLSELKAFGKRFVDKPMVTTSQVVQGITKEFTLNPFKFLGEYWAYDKSIKTLKKGVRATTFAREIEKAVFIAQQPKEIRKAMSVILNAAEAQRLLNPVKKIDLKRVTFFDVKELNRIEAVAARQAIIKTNSVVFGSKAARVLSKNKTKFPKDVDLATKNPVQFAQEFKKALPVKVRSAYKIQGAKIYRGNVALFDVKQFQKLFPNRSLFTGRGYLPVSGYVTKLKVGKGYLPKATKRATVGAYEIPTSPLVKTGGIRFTGFGEQTLRKALGTIQVLVEKNARRAKDPAALLEALEIQIQALKKTKPLTPIGKLRKSSKLKKLTAAVKLLRSKSFQKLLEKKVSGLTKEFPLVAKISPKKLAVAVKKKVKKKLAAAAKVVKRVKAKVQKKAPLKQRAKKVTAVKKKPKQPPKRKAPKRKQPSRLPKRGRSKVPSRVPRKSRSRVPSKTPSRLRRRAPSRVPSRVPSKLKARAPSRVPSRVPSKLKGVTPSRVPSRVPSKLKGATPSRVPSSRVPPAAKPRAYPTKPAKAKKLRRKDIPRGVKNPKGYDVYVKVGGKYARYNPYALRKSGVSSFGRWLSNNSVSRSFIIVGVVRKGKAVPKYVAKTPTKLFRKPKKNSKLRTTSVVEKRKYAINTRGERKGLSAARVLGAARRKRAKPKKKRAKRKTKK